YGVVRVAGGERGGGTRVRRDVGARGDGAVGARHIHGEARQRRLIETEIIGRLGVGFRARRCRRIFGSPPVELVLGQLRDEARAEGVDSLGLLLEFARVERRVAVAAAVPAPGVAAARARACGVSAARIRGVDRGLEVAAAAGGALARARTEVFRCARTSAMSRAKDYASALAA